MSKDKQYSYEEADFGAGKTKEILPPAHPELNLRSNKNNTNTNNNKSDNDNNTVMQI